MQPSAGDEDYGYPQVFEGTLDRAAVALGASTTHTLNQVLMRVRAQAGELSYL